MTVSNDLFDFVAAREGCKLEAYQDSKGVWTVGVGHTAPHVCESTTITIEEARRLFIADVDVAARVVNSVVQVSLTQHEFDALVDLCFNIGGGAFGRSTLVRKLNQKDFAGAVEEFKVWNKCGGRTLPGLAARRDKEAELFQS
jgi:lysozyme